MRVLSWKEEKTNKAGVSALKYLILQKRVCAIKSAPQCGPASRNNRKILSNEMLLEIKAKIPTEDLLVSSCAKFSCSLSSSSILTPAPLTNTGTLHMHSLPWDSLCSQCFLTLLLDSFPSYRSSSYDIASGTSSNPDLYNLVKLPTVILQFSILTTLTGVLSPWCDSLPSLSFPARLLSFY